MQLKSLNNVPFADWWINMKCLIICSSDDVTLEVLDEFDFSEYYVICADGGMHNLKKRGILPDLWVGDMDSFGSCEEFDVSKMIFPQDKDFTDSHIAVDEALKRGYNDIILIGATGGRLDHEFANYCLLKYILKSGGNGTIINKNNYIVMTDKNIDIVSSGMKYISFYPFGGDVENFSVKNVKYELENHLLTDYDTYTTSNEFCDDKSAKISFSKGYVLIICSNDLKGV